MTEHNSNPDFYKPEISKWYPEAMNIFSKLDEHSQSIEKKDYEMLIDELEIYDFIRNYVSIEHTAPNYYTINGQVVSKEEYDEAARLFCIKENRHD